MKVVCPRSGVYSELVALKSSVEVDLSKPVVVGGLGGVPAVRVEDSSAAEIHCNGLVEHEVDKLEFETTATGHVSISFLFLINNFATWP